MTEFQKRLAEAREANTRAATIDPDAGFQDPPIGRYIGKLTQLTAKVSNSGNPIVIRRVTITDPSSDAYGLTASDFQNLERDFVLARLHGFIKAHGVEDVPDWADWSRSEKQGAWVFNPDFEKVLSEIESGEPEYSFTFEKPNGYNQITVNEILEGTEVEDDSADVPDEPEPDDMSRVALLDLCARQGLEDIKADYTTEEILKQLGDFVFWHKDVADVQLLKAGYSDQKPEDGLSDGDIELLKSVGFNTSTIIMPEPVKSAPAASRRRRK